MTGEPTQSLKHLLWKHKQLSYLLLSHTKLASLVHVCAHRADTELSGALWTNTLANHREPDFLRHLISKNMVKSVCEQDTWHWLWHMHTFVHSSICICVYHANIHTPHTHKYTYIHKSICILLKNHQDNYEI